LDHHDRPALAEGTVAPVVLHDAHVLEKTFSCARDFVDLALEAQERDELEIHGAG